MTLTEQAKTFMRISRVADLGVIAASFAIAAALCQSLNGVRPLAWVPGMAASGADASSPQYALLFFFSLITWIPVAEWRGTYHSHRTERSWFLLWQNIVTQQLWVILTGCCVFLFKLELISRSFFLVFLPLGMLLLNLRQCGVQILVRHLRAQGFNLRSIAVVGDRDRAARFSEIIKRDAGTGYRIVAHSGADGSAHNVSEEDLDEVFVLLGNGASDLERLVLKFVKQGKRVHLVPGIFDATLFRQSLSEVGGVPVLSIGGVGMNWFQAAAKRLLDIIAPVLLLLVFGPVLAVVALAVKMSSPGPVLFTQERLGKGGRRFRIYKFRTMYQDAEKILHSDLAVYQKYIENNYKLPPGEDSRITPLGRFLRATSLDELPQLINVLRGDMSLVGPRPIVPPEIDKYGDYGVLFTSVKPGLTGNWQVSGRSEISDYSRRAALDIEYVRDQSLRTDIDILLKTIPAVLSRKGAH
jgi:exopolysaccharide biosynthesis polyprenyl glycosylphosphotransferase